MGFRPPRAGNRIRGSTIGHGPSPVVAGKRKFEDMYTGTSPINHSPSPGVVRGMGVVHGPGINTMPNQVKSTVQGTTLGNTGPKQWLTIFIVVKDFWEKDLVWSFFLKLRAWIDWVVSSVTSIEFFFSALERLQHRYHLWGASG